MTTTEISLISLAVGILGGWISFVFTWWRSYRQQVRQFEAKYVERYWKILDQLSLHALRATRKDPNLRVRVRPDDEKAIRSYILLCEDELEQRAAGRISNTTFREWRDGIHDQFKNPMFRKIWMKTKAELTFPYKHLGELLEDKTYDPLRPRKAKRVTG